jgi:cell division protein FtsI/penicillin-binding protein 2
VLKEPPDTDPARVLARVRAAYAPAGNGHPRVAVGVMLVASGAGGDTAAPAAKGVLQAALGATA